MAGTGTGQAQGIAPTHSSQRGARSSQAGRASGSSPIHRGSCPYPSDPAMIYHCGHRHRAEGVMGERLDVWLGAMPRACPVPVPPLMGEWRAINRVGTAGRLA